MFKVPEKCRITHGRMASHPSIGNNGAFQMLINGRTSLFALASDGGGWEHVSVHAVSDNKPRTPTWAEMCKIKDLFWDKEDTVVQFHPKESEYVNIHNHVLHLWREKDVEYKLPPQELV